MVHRQKHSMRVRSAGGTNELLTRVAIGRALTGRESPRRNTREVASASGDISRLIGPLDLLVSLADEARSGCSPDSLLLLHRIRLLAQHVRWVLTSDGTVSSADLER